MSRRRSGGCCRARLAAVRFVAQQPSGECQCPIVARRAVEQTENLRCYQRRLASLARRLGDRLIEYFEEWVSQAAQPKHIQRTPVTLLRSRRWLPGRGKRPHHLAWLKGRFEIHLGPHGYSTQRQVQFA